MNYSTYSYRQRVCFILLLISCLSWKTRAQLTSDNINFLIQEPTENILDSLNNKTLLKTQSLNPLKWLAAGAMYGYQSVVSPQILSNCPYQISCSNFAKQSISVFGLTKGVFLAADRLSRCNHLSTNTYAPVRVLSTEKIIDFPTYYRWR